MEFLAGGPFHLQNIEINGVAGEVRVACLCIHYICDCDFNLWSMDVRWAKVGVDCRVRKE